MNITPLILAIETSVGPCSVALTRGNEILAEETILDFHQQSRMLIPMCERVLAKAFLKYTDLDCIASSCGPGSFTSIRVGLAAAKALAFAINKPFYGVSTLEVLAFAAIGSRPIFVALDAHRSEVYAQVFTKDAQASSQALAIPTTQLREHFKDDTYVLAGNTSDALLEQFSGSIKSDIITPNAAMVASLVNAKLRDPDAYHFLTSAVYIRPPDAKLPSSISSGV